MVFYLNIGNTHVQVGEEVAGEIRLLAVYDTRDIRESGVIPLLEERGFDCVFAVCVVPAARERLMQRYGDSIHFLAASDFTMLDFSHVDTSTLGLDRIANAAAAHNLVKDAPVIVVDCGTCINTVVVNGAGQFLGGAIMPGRAILRRALHEHTAQLPLLEIRDNVPSTPIGTNTRDALAAGTDFAAIGTVRQVVSATKQALAPEECTVFVTGGDAPYFMRALPDLLQPAPALLTLLGTSLVHKIHKIHKNK